MSKSVISNQAEIDLQSKSTLDENKVAMEKSQYTVKKITVKKINSTEHDNFAQDILGIHNVYSNRERSTKILRFLYSGSWS